MTLSLVLPCFNEEGNIAVTVRDVLSWFDRAGIEGEVIAVNDGSIDRTRNILEDLKKEDPRVVVLHHETNRGYGAAICTGCDAGRKEILGFMDSDGQFHAEDIDRLLPRLQQYDFVSGLRANRADPFRRKLNAFLYGMLVRVILHIKCRDLNCGMKVFRRHLWPKIRPHHATGALFNAEVYLGLREHEIPFTEVPVRHYRRLRGNQTGARMSVVLRMFRELFVLKRSYQHRVKNTLR